MTKAELRHLLSEAAFVLDYCWNDANRRVDMAKKIRAALEKDS